MRSEKESLKGLLKKYEVEYSDTDLDVEYALQPWRCNRKYVELAKMVSSGTLENPCLLRFCHLTGEGTPLEELLYREFDLAEFISGKKIVAAGCFLPLSEQKGIRKSFGTRHRAALGTAETTDAVVLIVSEETGAISLAYNSNLYYDLKHDELLSTLNNLVVLGLTQSDSGEDEE